MADLWVPFAAAFIAAGAVLLVRQVVLMWTRRASASGPRPVAARAIIPVKSPGVDPVRMPRVEITPGRPISQARPVGPIIIGGPATSQPAPSPVIVTSVVTPAQIAAPTPVVMPSPVRETVAAVAERQAPGTDGDGAEPIAISTRTAPRRETPIDVESDQSRRLRIAVGPGRPTTTVGAEAKVWSQWTQEVRTPDSTPAQSVAPAAIDPAADEECPHCSSARYRGARFCGKCGRNLASAVTAS